MIGAVVVPFLRRVQFIFCFAAAEKKKKNEKKTEGEREER